MNHYLNVSPTITPQINSMDTARDMCTYLLGRYERQGPEEKQLFLEKLVTAQQGTLSIAQYFDQIQSLRLEHLARGGTVTEEHVGCDSTLPSK